MAALFKGDPTKVTSLPITQHFYDEWVLFLEPKIGSLTLFPFTFILVSNEALNR
jgi:hypothetical protein